tara:strand:+ start:218 stop:565 length:348 start_codon:yes stop_codon:yes gene_type:complete
MANLMNSAHYNLATMGQVGSAVIKDSTDASTPPSGKVFVAITMLTDCTFDTQNSDNGGLVAEDSTIWASTVASSTGSATNGQTVVEGITFPKGVTIYGRYTEIDLKSGTCIAYVG